MIGFLSYSCTLSNTKKWNFGGPESEAVQCYNAATLRRWDAAMLRRFGDEMTQCCNDVTMRCCVAAMLRRWDAAMLLCCSVEMLQFWAILVDYCCGFKVVQPEIEPRRMKTRSGRWRRWSGLRREVLNVGTASYLWFMTIDSVLNTFL